MFPSLREIPGAEDDNRPEALLAAVCADPAKVIVGNTVSVVEEKAPFQPPLFAHEMCIRDRGDGVLPVFGGGRSHGTD